MRCSPSLPVYISRAPALPHSVSSNRRRRAACQRAPILSNIPIRSAHAHAEYHSHEALSLAAPLAQPQEWRVLPPTAPPSLHPQNRTAGTGVWGRPRGPCSFPLGLPQRSLRAFSRGESGGRVVPSRGSPERWEQLNKASWACALDGSHLAFCEVSTSKAARCMPACITPTPALPDPCFPPDTTALYASRAPILAVIPARSAHTHACHHKQQAPSLPAPLAQLQGWRVLPPTAPPSLHPE